jgi:hypothetical protein
VSTVVRPSLLFYHPCANHRLEVPDPLYPSYAQWRREVVWVWVGIGVVAAAVVVGVVIVTSTH